VSTLEGAVTDNSCVTDTVDDSDEADVDDEGEGDGSVDGDDKGEGDDDDYDEGNAGDVEGDSEKIRDIVRSSTVDKYSHYIHHYFNWQDTLKANCQYFGCIQVIFDIFHPAGMTFTDWGEIHY